MKLFQNLTSCFRGEINWSISLKSRQCKKPPPRRPCFSTDQNFANNFWKGSHKEQSCENIPNSDQRFWRRRFFKNCPCSAKCSHSRKPCLFTDQTFTNNFSKGHLRKIPVELFQNWTSGFREKDFLRISPCLYSARSTHSPEPCLWTDQNFANNFIKGSPKEHSCEIILKSDQRFQRKRFFKNFFMSI